MDFLRKFETSIQAIGAGALKAPQVIYVKDVNKTLFSKYGIPNGSFIAVQDIDGQLTLEQTNALVFTALDATTISLTNYGENTPNVLYSRDFVTWTLWDYSEISIATGETLFIRGTNPLGFNKSTEVYSNFNISGNVELSGNIMSLITGGATTSVSVSQKCCFFALFRNCLGITKLDKNLLPATSVTGMYCYNAMFQNTSITDAPVLPATELGDGCYLHMFRNCRKLKTTPSILPATTLKTNCYAHMFRNCPLLTNTPILPATTLANYCYANMFRDCTSFTTAPELPATTLAPNCYSDMFNGCTKLNYIKCLATDISAANCTSNWVNGVAATGIFERDVTNNSWTTGVNGIPTGWCANASFGGLKFTAAADNSFVKTNVSGTWTPDMKYSLDGINWTSWDYTQISIPNGHWIYMKGNNPDGFNQSNTNYRYFSMGGRIKASGSVMSLIDDGDGTLLTIPTTNYYCFSYLFSGCDALLTVPELPATKLYTRCYNHMFRNCTRLTTIPYDLLPAYETNANSAHTGAYYAMFSGCTALTNSCNINFTVSNSSLQYCNMFRGCTSLKNIGTIAITSFTGGGKNDMEAMFRGCTSLTTIPSDLLQATTLKNGCYKSMFMDCTSLTTAPELPATTLAQNCYSDMFSGCTKLNHIKCLATDISAANCTSNWVNGVAATGTFVKNASMTSWTTGPNGIPSDWTVQDAA